MTFTRISDGRASGSPSRNTFDVPWKALQAAVLLTALCSVGFVLRSPDALTVPQFWAEDGVIFFQQQQAASYPLVFTPYAGYLHFVPRITAWAGSFLPIDLAPLFYNTVAWLLNSLCASYFLFRLAHARLAAVGFAAVFLTPTNGEIFGTLTNVQWISQLFLVAACFVPSRPRGIPSQSLIALVVLALSLTGPFSTLMIVLHVGVLAVARLRPGTFPEQESSCFRNNRGALIGLWVGGTVQLMFIMTSKDAAPSAYSLQLMLQALGAWSQAHLLGMKVMPATVAIIGLAGLMLMLTVSAPRPGKLAVCILFSLALLQIALASSKPKVIGLPLGYGDRYFFLFKVAIWVSSLYLLMGLKTWRRKQLTAALAGLFLFVVVVNAQNLQRRPLEAKDWAGHIEAISPGGTAAVPINPTPMSVTVKRPL